MKHTLTFRQFVIFSTKECSLTLQPKKISVCFYLEQECKLSSRIEFLHTCIVYQNIFMISVTYDQKMPCSSCIFTLAFEYKGNGQIILLEDVDKIKNWNIWSVLLCRIRRQRKNFYLSLVILQLTRSVMI